MIDIDYLMQNCDVKICENKNDALVDRTKDLCYWSILYDPHLSKYSIAIYLKEDKDG